MNGLFIAPAIDRIIGSDPTIREQVVKGGVNYTIEFSPRSDWRDNGRDESGLVQISDFGVARSTDEIIWISEGMDASSPRIEISRIDGISMVPSDEKLANEIATEFCRRHIFASRRSTFGPGVGIEGGVWFYMEFCN